MQSLILRPNKFTVREHTFQHLICYEISVDGLVLGTLYKHEGQSLHADRAGVGQTWLRFGCYCQWCQDSAELLRQTSLLYLVNKIYGFHIPVFHFCRIWYDHWHYFLRYNGEIILETTIPILKVEGSLLSFDTLKFDLGTNTGRKLLEAIQNVPPVWFESGFPKVPNSV